ncbi:MAG: hypothetical protein AVDCRST_MAG68-5091 [uncultured Gemmatimonadetes bacterium]|uniref:Uncharacterized protein n=1 Tax=uncultured Gemmatimonadota bacterium TaxID=203437 RepID=A0A6J4MNW7_9BACT|nr:MAG: hypothetical protein AVDCRST_MAG68-5091 [uncultured Gemmatimonadota bacterium]
MIAVLVVAAVSAAGWATSGWLPWLAFVLSQVPAAVVVGALLWHLADRIPWDVRPIRSYRPEPIPVVEPELAPTRLDDYRARKAA